MTNIFKLLFSLLLVFIFTSCNEQETEAFIVEDQVKEELINDLQEFYFDFTKMDQNAIFQKLLNLEAAFDDKATFDISLFYINEFGINRDLVQKIMNYSEDRVAIILESQSISNSQLELFFIETNSNLKASCGGWLPLGLIAGAVGTILSCSSCAFAPNPASCYGCGYGVSKQISGWGSFAKDGCLS